MSLSRRTSLLHTVCVGVSVAAVAILYLSPAIVGADVVEIVTEVYEYRIDEEQQIGLFHSWESHRGDLQQFDVDLPGTELIGADPIPGVDLSIESLSILWGNMRSRLKAAVREGDAVLISNPILIVEENTTGQIVSGEAFKITEFEGRGTISKLRETDVNTGVKLYFTPTVYREEYIILSIRAEVSEVREQFVEFVTPDGRRYELPQISKRTAQTVVILRSGEFFYIGGLIQESERNQERGVPGLANLPLIGRAFKGTNSRTVTTETIFHVEPRILEPGEGSSAYKRFFGEPLRPPSELSEEEVRQISNMLPSKPDASLVDVGKSSGGAQE